MVLNESELIFCCRRLSLSIDGNGTEIQTNCQQIQSVTYSRLHSPKELAKVIKSDTCQLEVEIRSGILILRDVSLSGVLPQRGPSNFLEFGR